jgi:peptidoglycan/LPS O-acetylase OafA/YrhL
MTQRDHDLDSLARDIATRATAAVGLAGIALVHLLDSIDTYADTRYVFWMYVALMLACLVLAAREGSSSRSLRGFEPARS